MARKKQELLERIVAELKAVRGMRAIALGGSHARGTYHATSDLDIGLYYEEAEPFAVEDIRPIAVHFSASGAPTVTEFYGWGPFVNGGAWIDNAVCKVDFLYRNLDQQRRIVAEAHQGIWTHSFDQQPPFGFRSVTALGEIHCCSPLHDPDYLLGALKAEVKRFPPRLKERIVQDALWCAEFSLRIADGFAKSGDVPNAVACMTRIFHYFEQALFALNETYFVNDKRALDEVDGFSRVPRDFRRRVNALFAMPGGDPGSLRASLQTLRALFLEIAEFATGLYEPKFGPSEF